ncbi:penicillin-binding transpeptidase domain-containing protein [Pseudactinotalea sp. Z1732]|uniref:penicillin-binding transpeptidase domain-containing protein n=2 Tax=Micrococcales TaxID=85006 RepID=UPI003C7D4A86
MVQQHPRRTASVLVATLTAVGLFLAGCSSPTDGEDADADAPAPELTAAEALAEAMAGGDFSEAPMGAEEREIAQADVDAALAQMEGIDREVEVSWVSSPYEEDEGLAADAAMRWHWSMPGSEQTWSYPISVHLSAEDSETWHATWSRDLIARELGENGVFVVERTDADRGAILDGDGEILVAERPVFRIGIDKTFIESDDWADAALALAEELDFSNPQAYADRVLAYGPRAFVDAVVIPQDNPEGLDLDTLRALDGVHFVSGVRIQGPTESFARPVLGRVGEATAEIIENSEGSIEAGDIIGLSGLQAQYEEVLRGRPAVAISVVDGAPVSDAGEGADDGEGAGEDDDGAGGETDGGGTGAEAAGDGQPEGAEPTQVFTFDAGDGIDLETTLDADMQVLAEKILAEVEPASALVALRPSDGHVLAVASGPGSQGWSTATLGQYAPGSTFKMVTALAMLREGMELEDTVQCPETLTVDGRTFSNNPGYPDEMLGDITVTEAIAHSCNTTFLAQHDRIGPADLASAATALGLLDSGEFGYPLFLGSVSQEVGATNHAAAMMGQGQVLASPMGMAVVAASLSAGQTVRPTLIRNLADLTADPAEGAEGDDVPEGGDTQDSSTDGDDGGADDEDGTTGDDDGATGDQAGATGDDDGAAGESEEDGATGVPGDDGDGTDGGEGAQATEISPLTHEEAAVLRQAMRAVVVDGTTPMLADVDGPPVVAKSGTAEHGSDEAIRTWVIAIQGDLAVAAFVEDGEYGAATSGPLVAEFLDGIN